MGRTFELDTPTAPFAMPFDAQSFALTHDSRNVGFKPTCLEGFGLSRCLGELHSVSAIASFNVIRVANVGLSGLVRKKIHEKHLRLKCATTLNEERISLAERLLGKEKEMAAVPVLNQWYLQNGAIHGDAPCGQFTTIAHPVCIDTDTVGIRDLASGELKVLFKLGNPDRLPALRARSLAWINENQ